MSNSANGLARGAGGLFADLCELTMLSTHGAGHMSVSADAPSLDIAYKLTEFAGSGRMKLSRRKRTLPGRKQVFRPEVDGGGVGDVIAQRASKPSRQRRPLASRWPQVERRSGFAQTQNLPSARAVENTS